MDFYKGGVKDRYSSIDGSETIRQPNPILVEIAELLGFKAQPTNPKEAGAGTYLGPTIYPPRAVLRPPTITPPDQDQVV